MIKTSIFFFMVWLLSAVVFVSAQEQVYHIGPRDVISLSITAGGMEQTKVELTVSEQGRINVPFIGFIQARGLTVEALEKNIFIPLERDYFVSPQVNIQIKEYHSISFFISGAVKSPGKYEMTSTTAFLELLAKAGGVLPERGNIAYVLREHHNIDLSRENLEKAKDDRNTIQVDLTALLDKGDMSVNIPLIPGDIIYIPHASKLDQASIKIYVEGQVVRPGVYEYQPGLTALSACIMAGGFDKYAAISRARIVRMVNNKQKIIKIDLKEISKGKVKDVPMKPGDRLHIPETWL